MSIPIKKYGSMFGTYGSIEAVYTDGGDYDINLYLSGRYFKSSISLHIEGLPRKQANKLLKFDFDNPEKSLKVLLSTIEKMFEG